MRKVNILDVANYIIKYYQAQQTSISAGDVYQRLEVLLYNVQLNLIHNKGPFTFQSIPYQTADGPRYQELDGYRDRLGSFTYLESGYHNISGYRFNPRILNADDQQVIYQTVDFLEHIPTSILKQQATNKQIAINKTDTQVKVYYTFSDFQQAIQAHYS